MGELINLLKDSAAFCLISISDEVAVARNTALQQNGGFLKPQEETLASSFNVLFSVLLSFFLYESLSWKYNILIDEKHHNT